MAVEYFRIIAVMFPFYLLMNVMNSMIRADGSPSYAMAAVVILVLSVSFFRKLVKNI